jgi:acyl-CoA synthetase (AMP-forming)/AMP-acid ligase II
VRKRRCGDKRVRVTGVSRRPIDNVRFGVNRVASNAWRACPREAAARAIGCGTGLATDFSRLRVAIGGGAAILPVTSEKWKSLTGKDILEGYGLSETSPILTLNPPGAGISATVGLPLPCTNIRLLDAQDNEVVRGSRDARLDSTPLVDRP